MSAETANIIIALPTLIINFASYYLVLPRRYGPIASAAILAANALVFFPLFAYLDLLQILGGGWRPFVFIPMMFLLFKGPAFQKLFYCFLLLCVTVFETTMAEAAAGLSVARGSAAYYWALILFSAALRAMQILALIFGGRRLLQKLFFTGRRGEWALYASGAFFTYIVLTFGYAALPEAAARVIVALFAMWGIFILCFAILSTHEKTKQSVEVEFARSALSSGRAHYRKMNELYDKMRTLRHDFKYHLGAVRGMLSAGNTEEANTYLTGMEERLADADLPKYCANTVLNALVAGYAERCAGLGIAFTVKLVIPESLGVPDYDLCIILGNLLENAVEASLQQQEGRRIEFVTRNTQAKLLFMVKNNYAGAIRQENGALVSTKATYRGLGLRSVEEVISQHGGHLVTEFDENTFTAYVAVNACGGVHCAPRVMEHKPAGGQTGPPLL
jgi:signal transduction histidine kinase